MDKDTIFSGISDEWRSVLDTELLDTVLTKLNQEDRVIVPPLCNLFEFARCTPLDGVKVVCVGQDPYPTAGHAHGLAFSCLRGIPSSLRNIFKCLKHNNLISEIPSNGDLTQWAKQGVLLLNGALTTVVGTANAHKNIWAKYTDKLILSLSNRKNQSGQHPIFMLWGAYARKKALLLNPECNILTWSHPSPLAQARHSFINCDHFSVVNQLLSENGDNPIDWNNKCPQSSLCSVDKYFGMNDSRVVAFTDGSCYPNKVCKSAIAGYASVFALGVFKDISIYGNIENRPHYASNQRAEGAAIYRTMLYLESRIDEWSECIIVSDSDFWINMIDNYMPSWVEKGIKFSERKNEDLTTAIWNIYTKLVFGCNKFIEFRHMRSHDFNKWSKYSQDSYEYFCWLNNDYVDKMAGYARKQLKPGTHKVEMVEYGE